MLAFPVNSAAIVPWVAHAAVCLMPAIPQSCLILANRYMYVVRYKKTFRYTKKVWAHDEASEARLGDVVRLQPLGYRIGPWKNYLLVKILHKEPRQEPSTNL